MLKFVSQNMSVEDIFQYKNQFFNIKKEKGLEVWSMTPFPGLSSEMEKVP